MRVCACLLNPRDQQGADPERVELCMKRFEEVYFVAEPGDALFFHALTLHSSRGNFSSERCDMSSPAFSSLP
jgi:ectoine hydroxylase-related dioxygenase (phytanoyl-CoA dioxygenase family)